jgi:uncharacterized protein
MPRPQQYLSRILIFTAACTLVEAQAPSFVGNWQGTLETGPIKLRLAVHVKRNDTGAYSATLDSIDQGAMGLPVAATRVTGKLLHLDLSNLRASFEGELSTDGAEIEGIFTQGVPIPLTLRRVAKTDTVRRPQNPKPPFPYAVEQVTYRNSPANVRLAGTLTRPNGAGPFPAVLLISGSGPQDRNETMLGHKPFWVLADALARRGIAVLRVDDRGVGGSTGDESQSTLDDRASDVIAGVAYLKARREVNPKKIGVLGQSEGGWVAPIAATRSPDIAFMVLMAAAAIPGDQVLYKQGELIARSVGATEDAIADSQQLQKLMVDVLRSEKDQFVAIEKIRAAWLESRINLPAELRAQVDAQIMAAATPEIRSVILHDPVPVLAKLRIPVLALFGEKDVLAPPSHGKGPMEAALAHFPDATVLEIPGVNHLFQTCESCLAMEAGSIEETISPPVLKLIGDWIAQRAR